MSQNKIKGALERALRWPSNFLFGDDIFISYSRADGTTYALGLADALTERNYTCRFDMWGTEPGKEMSKSLKKALTRSAVLVLVGTKGAATSEHVALEVAEMKRLGRRIVPIGFEGVHLRGRFISRDGLKSNGERSDTVIPAGAEEALWAGDIEGLPVSCEGLDPQGREVLKTGDPSPEVVRRIEKTFTFSRKDERLRKASAIVGGLLLTLIGASVAAGYIAMKKGQEASRKTAEAVAAEKRASDAERKAQQQEELVRLKTSQAEKAAMQATDAERLAKEQAKIAEDQTKLADAESKRADEQVNRAEEASLRAATQEVSAHKNLARNYYTQAQAEALSNPVRAIAWANMAVQEAPAGDENHPAYMLRAMNLALRSPASVFNFSVELSSVSFSPSMDIVGIMSEGGQFSIRDARTGEMLPHPYPDPNSLKVRAITKLVFSADGVRAAALIEQPAREEGKRGLHLRVWEARTGATLRDIALVNVWPLSISQNSLIFSRSGKEILFLPDLWGEVLAWDIDSGTQLQYEGVSTTVFGEVSSKKVTPSVSRNPERNWLVAVRSNQQVMSSSGMEIKTDLLEVRDIGTWKVLAKLPLSQPFFTLQEKALAVKFTPDARKVIVLSLNASTPLLRVWNLDSSSAVSWTYLPTGNLSPGQMTVEKTQVAISPDGKRLLTIMQGTSNNVTTLWDISSDHPVKLSGFDGSSGFELAFFTDDGEYLIGASTDQESRQVLSILSAHSLRPVSRPFFIPRGVRQSHLSTRDKTISIAYKDGTIQTWNLMNDGSVKPSVRRGMQSANFTFKCTALTPDRKSLLAVGYYEGDTRHTIQLWDVGTGGKKWERALDVPVEYPLRVIAFSPDSQRFIILSGWGKFLSWKDNLPRVHKVSDGTAVPGFRPLYGHFAGAEFSRDGTTIIGTRIGLDWADTTIERWSATTGESLPGVIGEPLRGGHRSFLGITRFGEYYITGLPAQYAFQNYNEITLWKVSADQRPLIKLRCADRSTALMTAALLRQAKELQFTEHSIVALLDSGVPILITDSPSGTTLMNVLTKRHLHPPLAAVADQWRMFFSPDGNLIATAVSHDTTYEEKALSSMQDYSALLVGVWDSATGLPLSERLWHEGPVSDIAFTVDGTKLLTTSQNGVLRSWFFGNFKGRAPKWMTRMGEALSGLRVVGGAEIQRIPLDEHTKLRREFFEALRGAASSGDEGARSLFSRQGP